MGADTVIAVKLRNRATPLAEDSHRHRPRSLLQTLMRSLEMMQSRIVTETGSGATILIEPAFGGSKEHSLYSFTRGRSYMELGETAAREALPRITAVLPWLRT